MNVGGIYVEIKGDSKKLRQELTTARKVVSSSAKDMSDAMGNALSSTKITRSTNKLVNDLSQLERSSKTVGVSFDSLAIDAQKLGVKLGVADSEFASLQSRMLKTQAAKAQESALRNIAQAAGLTEAEVRQLGKQMGVSETAIKSATGSSKTLSNSMFSMGGVAKTALAYFGVTELMQFGRAVFDTGLQIDTMERSFQAVFGTAEQVQTEFSYLRAEADRLGQNFYDLGGSYKQISAAAKGTALEGKGVRDVFSAVTEASAALGLSSDETSGALNALSQMISKGNVQAEELRGQLGERLPGAFQIAARAMGVSTAELGKMLENGEVLAEDLLPKLAEELHNTYGAAAETAGLESAQSATNKLGEAWTDLKASLSNTELAVSGINAVTGALEHMSDAINGVQESQEAQMLQWGILHQQDLDLVTGTWNVTDAMRARYEEVKKGIEAGKTLTDQWSQFEKGQKRSEKAAESAAKSIQNDTGDTVKKTKKGLTEVEKANAKLEKAALKSYGDMSDSWLEYEKDKIKADERANKIIADELDAQEKLLKNFDDEYRDLTGERFEWEKQQIKDQADAYEDAGADAVKVKEWEEAELKKIWKRETMESDRFFDGLSIGWEDSLDAQYTWAETGYSIASDFAQNSRSAVSDMLFDGITGDLDSLEQYWEATWQSMLRSMTNVVADMAVSWASSKLISYGGSFLSSLLTFHDGTTGIEPDEMLAVLQQGEIVIPAKQSEMIRQAIDGGTGMSKSDFFDSVTGAVQAGSTKSWSASANMYSADMLGIMMADVVGSGIRSVASAYNNYSVGMDMVDSLKASGLSFDEAEAQEWVKDQAIAGAVSNFVTNVGAQMMGDLVNYGMGFSQETISGLTLGGKTVSSAQIGSLLSTALAGVIGGPVGTLSMAVASPVLSAGVSGLADLFDLRENETYLDYMEDELGWSEAKALNRDLQAMSRFNPAAQIDFYEAMSRYATPELKRQAYEEFYAQRGQLTGGFRGMVSRTSHLMGREFTDQVRSGAYGPEVEAAFAATVAADPDFYSYDTREWAGLPSSNLGYSPMTYGSLDSGGNGGGNSARADAAGGTGWGSGGSDGYGGFSEGTVGRWAGGPVSEGHRYWINERGQEMIMPGYDGRVLNAQETSDMLTSLKSIATGGGLNGDVGAALVAIARYCQESSRVLKRWDYNGLPGARA